MDSPSERAVIALRSRPLFDAEKSRNCTSVLEFPAEDKNIVILGKNGFEFDRILSGTCQKEVFDMVQPILDKVWAGYSATVMAYGQTGAGKTYTMGTAKEKSSDEDEGVIPRTVKELFILNSDGAAKIFVSFTEVYNDGVYDLLSANPTRKMQARAFRDLGLQEVAVFSGDEALKRLEEGIEARRVSETQGNEKSSRSHAIFSLHIHRYNEVDSIETRSFVHLVDLAGSEAVGKAGNQGSLKLEGISINQGLLALSNCIRAVIQKSQHIPVRNTALTIVLQDALKGQCLLALIACISPSSKDENETAQTLRFAQAFHKIKSKPHIQKIVAQHAAKATGAIKKTNLPTPLAPRKPFLSIGNNTAFQPTNTKFSNYQFVARRTAASPSEFESPMYLREGNASMASNMSSASIFSHFSEHELNEFMSNVLVEKIEKLKKDTEDLVNKKIEDAFKNFGNKPLIDLEVLSQPESQNDFDGNLDLDATVIDVGGTKEWGTSTPNTSIHSVQTTTQSCQTSPAVGILIDLGLEVSHAELPREEVPVASCSSPEQPPVKKLRRSVRLSCMGLPAFLLPQADEPIKCLAERKKLRRSVRLSCMLLPQHLRNQDEEEPGSKQSQKTRRSCVPQMEDLELEAVPAKRARQSMSVAPIETEPRKQRKSLRLSCLALPNVCVRDAEEFKPAKKARRSIGPDILEEKLFHDSPSAGTVQEKHKRRLLELMNTESTKVIQQLPTVGPKTGYIIFCYRQIHGSYKSFEDLKSVPGLTANFLKRFFKANNIKL